MEHKHLYELVLLQKTRVHFPAYCEDVAVGCFSQINNWTYKGAFYIRHVLQQIIRCNSIFRLVEMLF